MSKKELNCTNCCIDDFKHNLCDCDGEFCKKFKCVGNEEDFIKSVMSMSERKMGKWIITSRFDDCYYAKCDKCYVTQVFYFGKPTTNYCPNCGADMTSRMRGEKAVRNQLSAQSELEDKIRAIGYTGKEGRIYIGGRLFAVRELPQ